MIRRLIKPLLMLGYAWLVSVGLYILLQYVRVLLTEGLPFEQRLFSFLNLWNILFATIALLPGLICILTANYFNGK